MKIILKKFGVMLVAGMIFLVPILLGSIVRAQTEDPNNGGAPADVVNTTGGYTTTNNNPSTSGTPSNNSNALFPTNVNNSNYSAGSSDYSGGSGPTGLRNPVGDKAGSLPQLLDLALKAVVDIGAIFGVLAIVYCGFLFLQAQGNESKLEEAKTAFYWTVIGLAILLGASVLEAILTNTINGLKAGL